MRKCSVDGCERKSRRHGFCVMHHWRWETHGDPNYVNPEKMDRQNFLEMACHYEGDECLEWPFILDRNGYGRISIEGKSHGVHRLICGILAGRDLRTNEDAMHACDNPPCCNPRHLSIGSRADNLEDARRKGRLSRKHRSPLATYSDEDVLTLRVMYASRTGNIKTLARKCGITYNAAKKMIRRDSYKHLLLDEEEVVKRFSVDSSPAGFANVM